MGRRAEGWALRRPDPEGPFYVRFTHQGRQREYSTGTRDSSEAAQRAAEKYAEIVLGRRAARRVDGELDKLVADFLDEYGKNHAPGTVDNAEDYFRAHIIPHFRELSRVTEANVHSYARNRLAQVTRVTVRKELSALRQFVTWAELVVPVPGLPKHGFPGKRAVNARKHKAKILSESQVESILGEMPRSGERKSHLVRPFFRVFWETALRPITIFRLRAPLHYHKGANALLITRDIDKAFDERDLPLSVKAREELDEVCPTEGIIFPSFDLREPFAKACRLAGVQGASVYDLRHSRLTLWANRPGVPLPGVSYAAGHKSLATTARYVQGQREAAEMVILGGVAGGNTKATRNSRKKDT